MAAMIIMAITTAAKIVVTILLETCSITRWFYIVVK
jgi:hypothetical protein